MQTTTSLPLDNLNSSIFADSTNASIYSKYQNTRSRRSSFKPSKRPKYTDNVAVAASVLPEASKSRKKLWETNLPLNNGAASTNKYILPLAADLTKSDVNLSSHTVCDFRDSMEMKEDFVSKPVIVCPNGHLYLEMMHETSKAAEEFLIAIAEPLSRPEHIQEFQITVFSLYAAIGIGITVESIVESLDKFSKNEISKDLIELLQHHGNSFGRVKIVLRNNRYFLEASTREDLEYMLSNPVIAENRIKNSMALRQIRLRNVPSKSENEKDYTEASKNKILTAYDVFEYTNMLKSNSSDLDNGSVSEPANADMAENTIPLSENLNSQLYSTLTNQENNETYIENLTTLSENTNNNPEAESEKKESIKESTSDLKAPKTVSNKESDKTTESIQPIEVCSVMKAQAEFDKAAQNQCVKNIFLFEIKPEQVGRVKECALTELRRPLLSEYDFVRDFKNPVMDISLKPSVRIRYYQERALKKMFSNGRARSGIIVLPCGAGKTLTGITAASTIRRSAMVLTSSSVAVDQWKRSFIEFSTIKPSLVVTLASDQKKDLPEGAAILISTYTMMAYSGKRSAAAERIINEIREREWGLLIFDEVQFAPAPAFRKINDIVKSHCKLGLTATLVREDDLIHDLQWLIGPKLYEANWLELQEANYLAKVQVSEVWCPMTADFYREYLVSPHAKQRKLWVCNPNKLCVCEYLIRFHEARNDKIIVFGDNLFALKEVALTLKKPFISGEVSMQERMMILNNFKTSSYLNTVFLSKVGDNAIDIPCANVVIQFSFNFASRRQEAQRLGRILRPKPASEDLFNAFFYSLISKDTQEMLYADKRQQFIIDQGYAYKVLPISVFPLNSEKLIYSEPQKQKELLLRIISTNDQAMDIEDDDVVLIQSQVKLNKPSQNEEKNYSVNAFKTDFSQFLNF